MRGVETGGLKGGSGGMLEGGGGVGGGIASKSCLRSITVFRATSIKNLDVAENALMLDNLKPPPCWASYHH